MGVIVLDASAWVDWLLGGHRSPRLAAAVEPADGVQVLDFTALEVLGTLRRLDRRGLLPSTGPITPVAAVRDAPYLANASILLAERIWELRHTHSPWDAAYVALAEALGCPLVTTDRRLARSHGHRATVIDCSEDA